MNLPLCWTTSILMILGNRQKDRAIPLISVMKIPIVLMRARPKALMSIHHIPTKYLAGPAAAAPNP